MKVYRKYAVKENAENHHMGFMKKTPNEQWDWSWQPKRIRFVYQWVIRLPVCHDLHVRSLNVHDFYCKFQNIAVWDNFAGCMPQKACMTLSYSREGYGLAGCNKAGPRAVLTVTKELYEQCICEHNRLWEQLHHTLVTSKMRKRQKILKYRRNVNEHREVCWIH